MGQLKAIADKHSIAVLSIHHTRKQKDDDPMNMVSGTTGITGAADSSFVLKETKRGSGRATLYCTGRDIEYREIELAQDKENHCWNLESDSLENPEVLLDDVVRVFAEFIKAEKKFIGSPTELAQKIANRTGHTYTAAALQKSCYRINMSSNKWESSTNPNPATANEPSPPSTVTAAAVVTAELRCPLVPKLPCCCSCRG